MAVDIDTLSPRDIRINFLIEDLAKYTDLTGRTPYYFAGLDDYRVTARTIYNLIGRHNKPRVSTLVKIENWLKSTPEYEKLKSV